MLFWHESTKPSHTIVMKAFVRYDFLDLFLDEQNDVYSQSYNIPYCSILYAKHNMCNPDLPEHVNMGIYIAYMQCCALHFICQTFV